MTTSETNRIHKMSYYHYHVKVAQNLQPVKVTIYQLCATTGVPQSIQATLTGYDVKDYVQHIDSDYVSFKPKGKRKIVHRVFPNVEGHKNLFPFAIVNGWDSELLTDDDLYDTYVSNGLTIRKHKYSFVDNRVVDLLKSKFSKSDVLYTNIV